MKRFLVGVVGISMLAVAMPVVAGEPRNGTECKITVEMTLAGLKENEQQTGVKQKAYGLSAEDIEKTVAERGYCAVTEEINRRITQLFTRGQSCN